MNSGQYLKQALHSHLKTQPWQHIVRSLGSPSEGSGDSFIAPLPTDAEPRLCTSPSLRGCTQPFGMLQNKTKGLHHSSATQIMQPPPL